MTLSWIQVGQSDGGTSSNLDQKKELWMKLGIFSLSPHPPVGGKKPALDLKI